MKNKKMILIGIGIVAVILLAVVYKENKDKSLYKDSYGYEHTAIEKEDWTNYEKVTDMEYALIHMDKEEITDISEHSFMNKITPILVANKDKLYTSIVFDDGTGICFPYSSLDYVAAYGIVDEKGNVMDEEGTLIFSGTQIVYTPINEAISAQTNDIYAFIPEKYFSDDLAACRDGNDLYIALSLSLIGESEEAVVEEFLREFSDYDTKNLKSFTIILNRKNGYVINPISHDIKRDDSVIQKALIKMDIL